MLIESTSPDSLLEAQSYLRELADDLDSATREGYESDLEATQYITISHQLAREIADRVRDISRELWVF